MHARAAKHPRSPLGMRTINVCSVILACLLVILNLTILQLVLNAQSNQSQTSSDYQSCQTAVTQLEETSDFLTAEARQYVETGDRTHLDNYLDEYQVHDRRGAALQELREHAESDEAVAALADARTQSDLLAQTELYAMRLVADAQHLEDLPRSLGGVAVLDEDEKLSDEDKQARANALVTSDDYERAKYEIRRSVQECSEQLIKSLSTQLDQTSARLEMLLFLMRLGVILLLLVVVGIIVSNNILLLRPMSIFEANIRDNQPLDPQGARELRLLVAAYNEMYATNQDRTESLSYEAHNDALTGALNRGSFDSLLTLHKATSALILVDIDYFKQFNDEYGHEMGDAILIEVAATLFSFFRTSDYVCRIGGDEFAVIMVHTDVSHAELVRGKVRRINEALKACDDGLPITHISCGAAYGKDAANFEAIFQSADAALYRVKEAGRCGVDFY